MMTLLKYKFTLLGLALGAIAGYAYYYFVGCASGTCAITSNPVYSTLYAALMGGVFFHSFQKENNNYNNNQNQ
jgi:FtsH-binding integral membrane protein